MHWIDATIFAIYMLVMLGVGYYFLRKNKGLEDYYVGGRNMGSLHVGLSVAATDVGGGFSIGLGGLGFTMGISGSWLLFTGLIGAWLSAVVLIPRIKENPKLASAFTFPDLFRAYYGPNAAFIAGIISAVGYVGFTSAQILAGAKLASATFDGLDMGGALIIMGAVTVAYTAMGGLKAVIYTDTIQWTVLMLGLVFLGLPTAYVAVGGYDAVRAALPEEMFSMVNLTWQTAVNWVVAIVPIWFVGMTLYQRIFACKDTATAKKAWYIAGLFEWPAMAFTGVVLGLLARAAAERGMLATSGIVDPSAADPEKGLPILLHHVLPVGVLGVVMSSYFSAILSTADSCLMACSGNLVSDIIGRFKPVMSSERAKASLRLSQIATWLLGLFALLLAWRMSDVLSLMLHSYAFMVSGLFVPVLCAILFRCTSAAAAVGAMLVGGSTTVLLTLCCDGLPLGLNANIFGIGASALTFAAVAGFAKRRREAACLRS